MFLSFLMIHRESMNEEDEDTSSVLFYGFFVDCVEEEKEVQIHETISIFFILYYDR